MKERMGMGHDAIRIALERHGGSRTMTAAAYLGIDSSTLWRKMKRYGIGYPPSA